MRASYAHLPSHICRHFIDNINDLLRLPLILRIYQPIAEAYVAVITSSNRNIMPNQ